jgi:hypothetical protein
MRSWFRGAAGLALAIGFGVSGVAGAAGVAPDSLPRRHIYSIHDSPGYVPLFDPESLSEVTGRRMNAPLVSKRFQGGAHSLADLGRTVCRALHVASRDSLLDLCVRDDEFRDVLWREFPQSRPAVGLTWEDAWRILYARMHAGCSHAIRDYGGHAYEFVGWKTDSIAHYRNFNLYSRLTLIARDDEGQIQRMQWLRAVAERKGSFKIYSTED